MIQQHCIQCDTPREFELTELTKPGSGRMPNRRMQVAYWGFGNCGSCKQSVRVSLNQSDFEHLSRTRVLFKKKELISFKSYPSIFKGSYLLGYQSS